MIRLSAGKACNASGSCMWALWLLPTPQPWTAELWCSRRVCCLLHRQFMMRLAITPIHNAQLHCKGPKSRQPSGSALRKAVRSSPPTCCAPSFRKLCEGQEFRNVTKCKLQHRQHAAVAEPSTQPPQRPQATVTMRISEQVEAGAGLLYTQGRRARQLRIHAAGSRHSSRSCMSLSSLNSMVHPCLSGCTKMHRDLNT